ncbi:MAG: sugar-transfer associated ATP-grasp domain-containing protein [Odoribacter splanchnicus]
MMKETLKSFLRKVCIYRYRNANLKDIKELLPSDRRKRLTTCEKREVRELWGKLGCKVDLTYPELFKTKSHYDKRFVPEDIYVGHLLPTLNPRRDAYSFVNKGLYDVLFKEIPHPKCILKNIMGVYWCEGKILSRDEAAELLEKQDEFVIKPSVDSFGGSNVRKIDFKVLDNGEKAKQIKELLSQYDINFVVQEVVKQHQETACFNPESLNTFRICSLFLNGKLSILTRLLRCGQNGSVVDNGFAGGIMIPVYADGRLAKQGLDHTFKRYEKSSNGIVFEGRRIENYPKLERFIEKYYRLFPTCSLIAWDLAIDETGEPLMVEVNLVYPGITEEQVSLGPFFGDRTEEVIDYVREHPGTIYLSL